MSCEHLEVRTEGLVDWVTMSRPNQLIALKDRNQALRTQDDDFREGVATFLEKRRPKYAGS